MLRNYLIIAIRNFIRHRLYSFINVAGLAVSISCAIFITLFVRSECSYDADLPNGRNIYQVTSHFVIPGSDMKQVFLFSPDEVSRVISSEISGIETATAIRSNMVTVKIGNRQFLQDLGIAKPNFFRVIRLKFLRGGAETALDRPDKIVLTEDAAKKYFGRNDVVGKSLLLEGHPYQVSAVLRNPPANSQFQKGAYISDDTERYRLTGIALNWFSINDAIFVRTRPGFRPRDVQGQLAAMVRRHADATIVSKMPVSSDQILQIGLHPLADVHLDAPDGVISSSGRTMVRGFTAIAILILTIAAFNFTNLSTACASLRSREVALRKTVGARKRQLRLQFLGESVFTALVALLFALALVELLLPAFCGLLDKTITFSLFTDYQVGLMALGMAVFCGFFGGAYPAVVLSRFRPCTVLKSGRAQADGAGRFRNILVVAQFAISIGLGIAAIAISAQIHYARNVDLGFQRDNIVVVNNLGVLTREKQKTLVQRLESNPAIVSAVRSNFYPLSGSINAVNLIAPKTGQTIAAQFATVSPGYFRLYGIRTLAGRALDDRHGADRMSQNANQKNFDAGKNVLVEARLARQLGFSPQEAVGKMVNVGLGDFTKVRIVGVVNDVRYQGPQTQNRGDPVLYVYVDDNMYNISVRIRGGHVEEGLKAIDAAWHQMAPDTAILRHFTSESFDEQFAGINRQARLFSIFVGIAIFIACLGLFGLAAFTAARRAKEIGIRKVFGARRRDIVRLLLWRFSIPVLIANVIAWPLAYLWLHRWLESYADHITLSPLYFFAAGGGALVIAWATVAAHAFRTASLSPVHALNYE